MIAGDEEDTPMQGDYYKTTESDELVLGASEEVGELFTVSVFFIVIVLGIKPC